MPQTSVNDEFDRAYEGKTENSGQFPTTMVTGLAAEEILFGKAVSSAATDVGLPKVVNGFTNGQVFQGVAIADPSVEAVSGDAFGSYKDEDAVPVMRKGRLWVVSAVAITNLLTDLVFVRSANQGGFPSGARGSFTNAATADYEAITGAKWVGAATVGAVNFGLLELNLP